MFSTPVRYFLCFWPKYLSPHTAIMAYISADDVQRSNRHVFESISQHSSRGADRESPCRISKQGPSEYKAVY